MVNFILLVKFVQEESITSVSSSEPTNTTPSLRSAAQLHLFFSFSNVQSLISRVVVNLSVRLKVEKVKSADSLMDVLGGNMGVLFCSNSSDLTNFHNHLMQQNLQNASSWDMMHT